MSESGKPSRDEQDNRVHQRGRLVDRRKKPTNPLSLDSLFGNRRQIRRASDRDRGHIYVDRYGPASVLLFVTVFVLSTLDAIFTLSLVGSGGEELNPVMDFFLQFGPVPFLVAKYVLTGGALFFLLIHKNHYIRLGSFKISGRSLFLVVLGLYVALIVYELYLLSFI